MSHPTRRASAVAGALDASQTWTQAATSWNSGTAPCTLPRHATVLTTPAPWYRVTTRARLGRPAGRITGPSAIYYIGRRDRRYRTHQQYLTWPEVRLTFYRFCGAHGASYSLKQLVLRFRRPNGPGRLTEPQSGGCHRGDVRGSRTLVQLEMTPLARRTCWCPSAPRLQPQAGGCSRRTWGRVSRLREP